MTARLFALLMLKAILDRMSAWLFGVARQADVRSRRAYDSLLAERVNCRVVGRA